MRYKTDIFLATMLSFWFFAAILLFGWTFVIIALSFMFVYGIGKSFNKGGKDYFIKSFCAAFVVAAALASLLYAGLYSFCEFPEEIPHIIHNIIDDYIVAIFGSSIPAALLATYTYAKFADKRQ